MARRSRLFAPGCLHHIIQRGNNRSNCFVTAGDRFAYMDFLAAAAQKYCAAIHAYVLMTNHVHLLVTPKDENSSGGMMQSLGRRYVRYFNNRHGRTGTLWEGRYKSAIVDSDSYFFTLCRYIELNPVRANMVGHPGEYLWSSFGASAHGKPDRLISQHPLYLGLGRDDLDRQASYCRMFDIPLGDDVLEELREATNKGWVFGSRCFTNQLKKIVKRPVESSGWGGDRRSKTSR